MEAAWQMSEEPPRVTGTIDATMPNRLFPSGANAAAKFACATSRATMSHTHRGQGQTSLLGGERGGPRPHRAYGTSMSSTAISACSAIGRTTSDLVVGMGAVVQHY